MSGGGGFGRPRFLVYAPRRLPSPWPVWPGSPAGSRGSGLQTGTRPAGAAGRAELTVEEGPHTLDALRAALEERILAVTSAADGVADFLAGLDPSGD